MIGPLLGLAGIFLILIFSEYLWNTKRITTREASRKLVHMATGTFIAFWPFFMSFAWIQALSVLLLVVVFASKRLHIFKSIHGVPRPTYGEVLFAVGIFLSATFAQTEWIYTAAVLHLALADGIAALVGIRFIKRFSYTVFGQTKTIIGSLAFYLVSLAITTAVVVLDPVDYGSTGQVIVIWLPVSATLLENIGVYGTDNLFVPVLVVGVLNSFQMIG